MELALFQRFWAYLHQKCGGTSGKVCRPGAALIGRAGVVCRALLLDCRSRVQILCCGIPLLHVGDSHLRGEADVHRALGLHLGQLLGLGGVQEVQLLHLAVRR